MCRRKGDMRAVAQVTNDEITEKENPAKYYVAITMPDFAYHLVFLKIYIFLFFLFYKSETC